MYRKLSIIISVIMHPLLMTSFIFLLLFQFAPNAISPLDTQSMNNIVLAVLVTTCVLPVVSIASLQYSNGLLKQGLSTLTLPGKRERVLPVFFTFLFYGITTYMFMVKLQLTNVLVVVLGGSSVIVLLVSLCSFFLRVSTHSAGVGSLIGYLLTIGLKYEYSKLMIPLVIALILSGLVMSARLYLNVHKPLDVLVGSLIGLGVSAGSVVLFG